MDKINIIIIIVMLCIFTLVGCNNSGGEDNNKANNNNIEIEGPHVVGPHIIEVENGEDYTGCWSHIEFPNDYSMVITRQKGNTVDLEITAVRDKGYQIATAEVRDVTLLNGKGTFNFEDSFGNTGICEINISENMLDLKYEIDESTRGLWGIDFGEGGYQKEDRVILKNSPNEDDLIVDSSFYAKVPKNRYGGNCEDYDYAPGEFLLWLSPMEINENGEFKRKNSIAVPYIVSDEGNSENLSMLSGGNDGEKPYGEAILLITTDGEGRIIDAVRAEEVATEIMNNSTSRNN